jgi:hypothetical protein
MMTRQDKLAKDNGTSDPSRRRALARLGLAAAVVYVAPTITHIDGAALAKKKARPSVPGGGKSKSQSKKKKRKKSGKK